MAMGQRRLSSARLAGPFEMDIRFTIFTTVAKPTQNTSNVPDSIIRQQVADLNAFYEPYVRFGFRVYGLCPRPKTYDAASGGPQRLLRALRALRCSCHSQGFTLKL
jgi:hypothetical protein